MVEHYWLRVKHFFLRPVWRFNNRYNLYRSKPNPWRHGGRRGKKKPTISEYKQASSYREYRTLQAEGWVPR